MYQWTWLNTENQRIHTIQLVSRELVVKKNNYFIINILNIIYTCISHIYLFTVLDVLMLEFLKIILSKNIMINNRF